MTWLSALVSPDVYVGVQGVVTQPWPAAKRRAKAGHSINDIVNPVLKHRANMELHIEDAQLKHVLHPLSA